MKKVMMLLVGIFLTSGSLVQGQEPEMSAQEQALLSREMWYYQQMRRDYDDPRVALRAKAAEKAAQRRARIASRKWYGVSNSRPTVSVDPLHMNYSHTWVSNTRQPYHWAPATPNINVHIDKK